MSQVHDRSVAYALNALDGIDRVAFEAHLTQCTPCRGDVEDIKDAAELLSIGIELPVGDELRARVSALTELPRIDTRPVAAAPAMAPAADSADESGSRARRRRWFG